MIERFNVRPLMPPSEVEQLAFDLLADLAPVDERPESKSAVDQFVRIVVELCHDWRSLWYLHGETRSLGANSKVSWMLFARSCVRCRPCESPVRTTLRRTVLQSRLLAMLFGGASSSRQEAAEFNAGLIDV